MGHRLDARLGCTSNGHKLDWQRVSASPTGLAYKNLRFLYSSPQRKDRAWRSVGTQSQAEAGHSGVPTTRLFLSGFATNISNPKGIVFMVAILLHFINQTPPLVPQLALMALTMTLVDTLVMTTYAYSANRLQHYLRSPSALSIQSRFFGGVLMTMGAALLMVKNQAVD
ncbi:LysE family translocator [Pseudomonas protegens]|uniref:LysE family translocator n=1 Tax=Pseudomonas protegens TaxID=380021 RepID=UPI000C9B5D89|nr:LysE family translocator [Pseudomonas protegens]